MNWKQSSFKTKKKKKKKKIKQQQKKKTQKTDTGGHVMRSHEH